MPTPNRYVYADDCWSCGRSQESRFGPREHLLKRCCFFCGADPDRPRDRTSATSGERQRLRRHFDVLDARERVVILLRWRRRPASYVEVGKQIGRSRSFARYVEMEATRKLRLEARTAVGR